MLRRVWFRLNFVSTSSEHFYCSRNVVEHAQAHCNYTTYKMAASEDAPEFSEELQENESKCQSKNKKTKADLGKGVEVSKSKRWSSEVVHALSFPPSKSNTIRAATHLRLNSIVRTRDSMQPRNLVLRPRPNASHLFAVEDLLRGRWDRLTRHGLNISQHIPTNVEGMLRKMLRLFDRGFKLS